MQKTNCWNVHVDSKAAGFVAVVLLTAAFISIRFRQENGSITLRPHSTQAGQSLGKSFLQTYAIKSDTKARGGEAKYREKGHGTLPASNEAFIPFNFSGLLPRIGVKSFRDTAIPAQGV